MLCESKAMLPKSHFNLKCCVKAKQHYHILLPTLKDLHCVLVQLVRGTWGQTHCILFAGKAIISRSTCTCQNNKRD